MQEPAAAGSPLRLQWTKLAPTSGGRVCGESGPQGSLHHLGFTLSPYLAGVSVGNPGRRTPSTTWQTTAESEMPCGCGKQGWVKRGSGDGLDGGISVLLGYHTDIPTLIPHMHTPYKHAEQSAAPTS